MPTCLLILTQPTKRTLFQSRNVAYPYSEIAQGALQLQGLGGEGAGGFDAVRVFRAQPVEDVAVGLLLARGDQ